MTQRNTLFSSTKFDKKDNITQDITKNDPPWYPPGLSAVIPSRLMFPNEAIDIPNLAL